jgi:ribosomal protein S18 acetylase RimI-like enzyme
MMTTRPARDGDVSFLVDVFLRSMRAHIAAARGFWDEIKERSQFLEQLRLDRTRIIERDGMGIGFLMTLERGDDIELHTLCIAPEHQRQGFGTQMTRELLNEASSRGRGMVLSVLKVNAGARALYIRLGFAGIGESTHHYRMRHAL